ncbi:MAG: spore germination protein, partial [Clostridiales bacterium]|nr:spore germination protein [Clostridiales bacterium]
MNNEIYNRQLGAIVFIVALCFKIGVLPGLLANQVANPLPLIFCACLLEFLMYALVIRFGGNGGMDMLEKKSNVFYKIVMSVLVVYFLAKGTVLTGSLILMIEELLFDNISVYLVITILLITVTYIAVKGIKGIARMSEMLGPLIALSILVNLVFLKSRMNFANNLPVITDNFSQYIKAWGSYGAWFFDSMPFLFVTL